MTYEEATRKVALLLKLAERGGTPDEAATAFAKAQEIIQKYRLNIDDLDFDANAAKEDSEPVVDFGYNDPLDTFEKSTHYRVQWTLRLASLVAFYNQCAIRWMKHGGPASGATYRVIGRPSDVQTVRYLYSFFRNQIDALRKEYCVGHSSTFIGEFCTGCVDTLSRKLEEQSKRTSAEARQSHSGNALALVRVDKAIARIDKRRADVEEFLEEKVITQIVEMTGLPRAVVALFRKGRFEEARAMFTSAREFAAARKAYNSCFAKGRGYTGAGSRTSTGGRAVGRKAGESIRTTGAKAGLGSGRKEIGQ